MNKDLQLAYEYLPEGYVIVPKEPTQEMVKAGCATQCKECHADCEQGPYGDIFKAMIAKYGDEVE